jgi:hypothetical protein
MDKPDDKESARGWILMFDGHTTAGWRTYLGTPPPQGWECENGCLKCSGFGRNGGGDIVYASNLFRDFHLKFDWKISAGGNSGVFYMAKELPGEQIWKSGFEMQILDNEGHPDASLGKDNNRKAGSLYDLIPAVPQNARPAGEWNSAEIISDNMKVTHYMNGEIVLEFLIGSGSFIKLVKQSKFSSFTEFGKYRDGFVGLQDHNSVVWYRNIMIRKLNNQGLQA